MSPKNQHPSAETLEDDTTIFVRQTRTRWRKWEESHTQYLQQTPTAADGKKYIAHAKILVDILLGVSEIHPIFKSVVSIFNTVVLYEEERGENDARVACLFLAQSHMMDILLRIDEAGAEMNDDEPWVRDTLQRMALEIKDSGNSIDAYYKEKRIVRFLRAMDWKGRLNQHIEMFNQLRGRMQDHLSIATAQTQQNMSKTMNRIFDHLMAAQQPWEKQIANLDSTAGRSTWLSNDETLKSVLIKTEDPSIDLDSLKKNSDGVAGVVVKKTADGRQPNIAQNALALVREALQLSLEDLCSKNYSRFELKLEFHTEKLQAAIDNSTRRVMEALEGPHAQLEHEDLRRLWKAAKWSFWVNKKTFVYSLYEFYQEQFLIYQNYGQAQAITNGTDATPGEEVSAVDYNGGKPPAHPDAWTLHYFEGPSRFEAIEDAFDHDKSGFIRISEANAFTRRIPQGMTLPQWCVYEILGWQLESHMYQLRLRRLLLYICDIHARVLPANAQNYVLASDGTINDSAHNLIFGFRYDPADPYPPDELRDMVQNKMRAQDEKGRADLAKLKYTIDDANTIRMMFGHDIPVEHYLLRFIYLIIERLVQIMELSTEYILDEREWRTTNEAFYSIRSLVNERVSEVLAQKNISYNDTRSFLKKFSSGIFNFFGNTYMEWKPSHDRFNKRDLYLVDPFPILPEKAKPDVLKYLTWEHYLEKRKELKAESPPPTDDAPAEAAAHEDEAVLSPVVESSEEVQEEAIPCSWELNEDEVDFYMRQPRALLKKFPHHLYGCVECSRPNISGKPAFHCSDCDGAVLCSACVRHKALDDKHKSRDTVLRTTVFVPRLLAQWLVHIATDEYIAWHNGIWYHDTVSCHKCGDSIERGDLIARCSAHWDTCIDVFLCRDCINNYQDSEQDLHKSWHHLLIVHRYGKHLNPPLVVFSGSDTEGEAINNELPEIRSSIEEVKGNIGSVERRLDALEGKVDEVHAMLTSLLKKIDHKRKGTRYTTSESDSDSDAGSRIAKRKPKRSKHASGRRSKKGKRRSGKLSSSTSGSSDEK